MARGPHIPTTTAPRGFTLIELAVVVVILAIVTSIAVPRYANALSNYRVNAAARRIAAEIAVTQNRARALSTTQSITFSTAANTFSITGMADPDHPASTYTVSLANTTTGAVLASALFSNSSTLSFNGYGVPSSAGSVVITSGAATRTLTIAADSGTVTIQ